MPKTLTTEQQIKQLTDRIAALELKRRAAAPKARGIYVTKIRQAQAQIEALAPGHGPTAEDIAAADANMAAQDAADEQRERIRNSEPAGYLDLSSGELVITSGPTRGRKARRAEAKPDPKPAKKPGRGKRQTKPVAPPETKPDAPAETKASVWDGRFSQVIEADGEAVSIYTTKTPHHSTGLATRLRQALAAGKYPAAAGREIEVKSHKGQVIARLVK